MVVQQVGREEVRKRHKLTERNMGGGRGAGQRGREGTGQWEEAAGGGAVSDAHD